MRPLFILGNDHNGLGTSPGNSITRLTPAFHSCPKLGGSTSPQTENLNIQTQRFIRPLYRFALGGNTFFVDKSFNSCFSPQKIGRHSVSGAAHQKRIFENWAAFRPWGRPIKRKVLWMAWPLYYIPRGVGRGMAASRHERHEGHGQWPRRRPHLENWL